MSRRETIASEFQWKNFGFSGVSLEKFFIWQWRVPPVLIVSYKILMSAYLISTLLYNFLTFESDIPWPAYITNWTYTLLTTYHVVHTVLVLHHFRSTTRHTCLRRPSLEEHHGYFQKQMDKSDQPEETQPIVPSQQQNDDDLPPHLIVLWIIYDKVNAICPIVTCLWYVTAATSENAFLPQELFVHALNTVVVLVDQLLCAIPVRLFHFPFPVVFGLLYYPFSIVYWMVDHRHVVYKVVLDWNHPALPFGMIIITSSVAVVFHCISYGIYRGRLALYYRLVRGN